MRLTVVDTDTLENKLVPSSMHCPKPARHQLTFAEYMGSMGDGKKMGCLSANFSMPPLMMLQLRVIMPACQVY